METFDLNPCKSIGQIKEAIKEAILEGDIKNDYNDLINTFKVIFTVKL